MPDDDAASLAARVSDLETQVANLTAALDVHALLIAAQRAIIASLAENDPQGPEAAFAFLELAALSPPASEEARQQRSQRVRQEIRRLYRHRHG